MSILRKLKYGLSTLGLSEEEVAFYVAIVKNPNSSVYRLSQLAKIPKDQCYQICESLEDKELISVEGKRNKLLKVLPLDHFLTKTQSEGRKIERTVDKLLEMQPCLAYLGLDSNENMIDVYSEEEISEKWIDLTYSRWPVVKAYGDFAIGVESVGIDADQYFMKRRVKNGAQAYPVLANPSGYALEILQNDFKELRDSRVIFSDQLSEQFVTIVPDIDTTVIWSKNVNGITTGATIKSKMIMDFHQKMHDYFYSVAEANSFRKIEK